MDLGHFYGTGYEALFTGISAVILAQITKFFVHLIWKRKVDLRLFTTTGGMPSSHTAGVIALSTSVALLEGLDSISFEISLGFSLIIMQDASGVRRAAGTTAATLNRLVDEFIQKNQEVKPYETLKELLGHTPLEVFCGMLLGIAVPLVLHFHKEIVAFFG